MKYWNDGLVLNFEVDTSTAPNPSFRTGSKAPLSINPEQTPGFRPGNVEGLIFDIYCILFSHYSNIPLFQCLHHWFSYGYPDLRNR